MALLPLAAILALVAAFCIALQVVFVEYGLAQGEGSESSSAVAMLVTVAVSVVVFLVVLPIRGTPVTLTELPDAAPFLLIGVLNPVATRLLYYRGIDKIGGSLAVIIFSMYPAAGAILAVVLLGETLSIGIAVGIAGIIAGVAVLQTATDDGSPDEHEDMLTARLAAMELSDAAYPFLAMLLVAVAWVLVKVGLNQFPYPLVATTVSQLGALAAAVVIFAASPAMRRQLSVPDRRGYTAFAAAGIVVAVALLAQFVALQIGTVVTVLPLLDTAPLWVVGISYLVARQIPRSPRILLAIVLIIGGTALVQVL